MQADTSMIWRRDLAWCSSSSAEIARATGVLDALRKQGVIDARGFVVRTGGSMLAAVYLVLLLPALTAAPWDAVGSIMLLILALGYFQTGVHFDPAFRWIGLLLMVGYVLVLTVSVYVWVTLGVLFALALVATGLYASTQDAAV